MRIRNIGGLPRKLKTAWVAVASGHQTEPERNCPRQKIMAPGYLRFPPPCVMAASLKLILAIAQLVNFQLRLLGQLLGAFAHRLDLLADALVLFDFLENLFLHTRVFIEEIDDGLPNFVDDIGFDVGVAQFGLGLRLKDRVLNL